LKVVFVTAAFQLTFIGPLFVTVPPLGGLVIVITCVTGGVEKVKFAESLPEYSTLSIAVAVIVPDPDSVGL